MLDSTRYLGSRAWLAKMHRRDCRGSWIDFAMSEDFMTLRTTEDPLRHWNMFPWAGCILAGFMVLLTELDSHPRKPL